jgi:hypothetical protein
MRSLIRPRLLVAAGVLLALGVGVSQASAFTTSGEQQPRTVDEFLTAVTEDVDSYWEGEFAEAGLPVPRVAFRPIPAGQTASSACGGGMGDSAAAYCPADDTIYISETFATNIAQGALDRVLPGSSQGFGGTYGSFAVAYIVAHEYGHQVQDELGLFERGLPTVNLELQADCFAGTWANHAFEQNRVDSDDIRSALNAALAVGDFDASNPGHHGTPDQRAQAWNTGFESGDPSACNAYVS